MGKRELVLVLAFVAVGVVVYQATAPPPRPGERGFSIGRLLSEARREIGANNAREMLSRSAVYAVDPSIREVRVTSVHRLAVVGEARPDIAADLNVESTGFDTAEAKALAERSELRVRPSGDMLVIDVQYPREGRQTSELTLKLPDRLGLTLGGLRGDVTVRGMRGAVRGDHRDGRIEVIDASTVRLVGRRSRVRLEGITGETIVDATDGDLELKNVTGEARIEARRLDIAVDATGAPLEIVHTDGRVTISHARHALRIEGRRTRLRVGLDAPILVSALTTDAPLDLELPPTGGITLDAIATRGNLRLDDPAAEVTKAEDEQRAALKIRGGGSLVTLRNTRGDIVVKTRIRDLGAGIRE